MSGTQSLFELHQLTGCRKYDEKHEAVVQKGFTSFPTKYKSHKRGTAMHATPLMSMRALQNAHESCSSTLVRSNPTDLVQHLLANDKRSFHCTECGKCCTGAGEVFVNEDESQRIAAHLNMSLARFQQRYTLPSRKHKGWRLIKSVGPQKVPRRASVVFHWQPDQDCVFLRDKLCTIYPARPVQCSTYPWWPELMTARAWAEEAAHCEGINHESAGPLDVHDAAAQLHAMVQHTTARDTLPTQGEDGPFDFLKPN